MKSSIQMVSRAAKVLSSSSRWIVLSQPYTIAIYRSTEQWQVAVRVVMPEVNKSATRRLCYLLDHKQRVFYIQT